MCSCDKKLVTVSFLWEKLSQFYKDLNRKTAFLEWCSWFSFNNWGLALGTNLKFYTSVAKGLKLKVRMFWGQISTFLEVTGGKLAVGAFLAPSPPTWIGLIKLSVKKSIKCSIQKQCKSFLRLCTKTLVSNWFTQLSFK